MSLALPGMTGVEASELLGIIMGLLEIFSLRHVYSSAVLLTCSQFVITHVFLRVNPVGRRGQEVWPAIAFARRIVDVFEDADFGVSAEMVSRLENQTSLMVRSEIGYRRAGGWWPGEDRWPYHAAFETVFHCVARNCSYPMLDLPPFCLSDVVPAELFRLSCMRVVE